MAIMLIYLSRGTCLIVKSHDHVYRFSSTMPGQGFKMTYNVHNCDSATLTCTSVCRDYNSTSGTLTSPYYPAPYPDGSDCTYTISQASGATIALTILNFGIEDDCANDFLEIRDGNSVESPLIGRFCGNINQIPETIESSQNHLWIM